MSKYDNMMVIEGGVCQNMTVDDNRGGGGQTTPKMYDVIYG